MRWILDRQVKQMFKGGGVQLLYFSSIPRLDHSLSLLMLRLLDILEIGIPNVFDVATN